MSSIPWWHRLITSSNPMNTNFALTQDKEERQIFTFKRLKPFAERTTVIIWWLSYTNLPQCIYAQLQSRCKQCMHASYSCSESSIPVISVALTFRLSGDRLTTLRWVILGSRLSFTLFLHLSFCLGHMIHTAHSNVYLRCIVKAFGKPHSNIQNKCAEAKYSIRALSTMSVL